MAAVLALLIAVPLAFIAALRQGGAADAVIRGVSQISLSMPVFYIGLMLLIVLGRRTALVSGRRHRQRVLPGPLLPVPAGADLALCR